MTIYLMIDSIITLDKELFLILNNNLEHWFNDIFLGGFTIIGYTHFLLPIAASYLYIINKHNFRSNLFILIAAALFGGFLIQIIKHVVQRPRPLSEMAPLILAGKVHIHNLFYPYHSNSFPSGHTQSAFGIAVVLICINQRHVTYLLLIASLIGLSRIYVGVHFPLDVICGAIVGALSSLLVFNLCSKYFPKQEPLINNKVGL